MTTPATNLNLSFFRSLADEEPAIVTTKQVAKAIVKPPKKLVDNIARIRLLMAEHAKNGTIKQGKNELKKLGWKTSLPCVTISGIFEGGHQIAHLKELSGLMQVDFDQVYNLEGLRSLLRNDPYTHLEFLSPSGLGTKLIVKYTGNHLAAFEALREYYEKTYCVSDTFQTEMDPVCKDVSRVCFLSHDPECLFNENSAVYEAASEAPEVKTNEAKPTVAKPTYPRPTQEGVKLGVSADVEKVVDQLVSHKIDITGGYKDWLKLGFSIASEFGASGLGYFQEISQFSPTYNPQDCERQFSACCRDNGPSKATIKTLFGYAKDHGIDIKPVYSNPASGGSNGAKKAVSIPALNSVSVAVADLPLEVAKEQPGEFPRTVEVVEIAIPYGIECEEMITRRIKDTTEEGEGDEKAAEWLNGFFVRDSAFWVVQRGHGKPQDLEVSNFCMETLFHFNDDSKNTRRLIKLQRNTGEISVVEVLDSETSPDKFEVILKSRKCSFYGSAYTLKRIFKYCMDNELSAKAIVTLGYNPDSDIYALSDSIIVNGKVLMVNEVGIIKNNDTTFYLPAWSSYNRENTAYVNERRFRYIEGKMDFKAWAENIYQAYDLNGAIGICYVIQCLFRDVIFSQINFFPFLFLFGPPGVGKTTFIDILLRLFGEKEPGVSVKGSTIKAIARAASQRRNAILFLKEYDNSISPELENACKNFYDGQGYSTAQTSNDNKTQTWLVHSGIIFDGNALPTKSNAFFDRNIVCTFDQNKFTKESTAAYTRLNLACDEGFGQVLVELLSHRETFKKNIRRCFNSIYNELKGYDYEHEGEHFNGADKFFDGVNVSKLPERTLKHIAFILSTVQCLKTVLNFPFDWQELCNKVVSDAIEKNDMMAEINDISLFWDSLQYTQRAESQKMIAGRQYLIDALGMMIYIKMNDCYPIYVEYCKRSNLVFSDKQTLVRLLTSESYLAFMPGDQKSRGKTITKHGFGSSYRFRIESPKDGSPGYLIAGKEVILKDGGNDYSSN